MSSAMKSCLAVFGFVFGVVLSSASQAASTNALQIEPPPSALACITPAPSNLTRPAYPRDAFAAEKDAVVRVRLSFAAADEPPRVEVIYNSGDEPFAAAVREQVANYRLPCLSPGELPLIATQEFQFVAKLSKASVFWGAVHEAPSLQQQQRVQTWLDCVRPSTDELAASMFFPRKAMKRNEFGRVVVKLKFVAPDAPPEVTVVYDASSSRLAFHVRSVAATLRMPCLAVGDPPVEGMQTFAFAIAGEETLQDEPEISLQEFLKIVKGLDRYPARFDFTSMACPFQLKMVPLQPFEKNEVGQIGNWNPNRAELVAWLRELPLDLPTIAQRRLIGGNLFIDVACGGLDLL